MNNLEKKLLFIHTVQFGYHVGSLRHCQYLKNHYDITFICFDSGKGKVVEDGIEVIYIDYNKGGIFRRINFIFRIFFFQKKRKFDCCFVLYFQFVSILGFFLPKKSTNLDIRTGAIGRSKFKRSIYNRIMSFESFFFENVSIISECLRHKLRLNEEKCHVLPLGSDSYSSLKKNYDVLKLLYVGTLNSRNIDETIYGLSKFLYANKGIKISYDIIGYGFRESVDELVESIKKCNLTSIVTFHGRKMNSELRTFFESNNIGVSFIPMLDYFDCQPPTKTFEYINSGLVCIGTSTFENSRIINSENGVLCLDNANSFAEALENVYAKRITYSSSRISKTLPNSSWKFISDQNLKPYIKRLIERV